VKITLNGEAKETSAKTIAELVKSLGYDGDYFAVARNLTCVPRAQYANTSINDNDEIEILMPMQGG
jgi:sulfur carrier protein